MLYNFSSGNVTRTCCLPDSLTEYSTQRIGHQQTRLEIYCSLSQRYTNDVIFLIRNATPLQTLSICLRI